MRRVVWEEQVRTCADPSRAEHYWRQLLATEAGPRLKSASPEQIRVLLALFSGSQALSELLIAHPEWLPSLDAEHLAFHRQQQGLAREINPWLQPALASRDYAGALARLRIFKQRELLRIAVRDLAQLGTMPDLTLELSDVADLCLDSAFRLCWQQIVERLGLPHHQNADGRWQPTAFCVMALGKLGGQELNYSSDVDVIFVYSEEGHVFRQPPGKKERTGKGPTNHVFYTRLAEAFISEITRLTAEGMLYRVDVRLRPEGDAGPLVRSLESYENYYAQWGQTWERMMLMKARLVAGDAQLATEFIEMVQPFRHPRSLGERALHEIAATKQRIEQEVVRTGEIERNVKLGRGGIREIEFTVQTLQLLHAGRIPFLQSASTLTALQKLAEYKLLPRDDAEALARAYSFLRNVEHRLQMENQLQTHTIPTDRKARERLARLMGFETLHEFEAVWQEHAREVRRIYDHLIKLEAPTMPDPLPRDFTGKGTEWQERLARHGFRDPEKGFKLLRIFVNGPGYVHVSARTTDLAMELLPRLLAFCPPGTGTKPVLSDPDRVLARLDSYIAAYGTRAMLYETWSSNPSLFELLILLFDRSEFLAETAIRMPDLVDHLALSGQLRRRKTATEILADLRHGLGDADQKLWLRQYHQSEFLRIGSRDILGLADAGQNFVELSALADACLQYAVEVLMRRHRLKQPPFAIIGLGKLGGAELNYGSDLDILFVADNATRDLPASQKIAAELMDLLSENTEAGATFATDARLRPDGEKGLLVNTVAGYQDYYRQRAALWEIQALTRARAVAGEASVGKQFETMAAQLTNFAQPDKAVAAFTPDWQAEMVRMRERIERERTPPGKDPLAIKTGKGGLMDAEFIAQYLCLAHGWQEPNTLHALQRAREAGVLGKADATRLLENFAALQRIERILRRWSYAGETVLPDDPAPLQRVAIRCGFAGADEFMRAVEGYRTTIRAVFEKVFSREPWRT